MDTKHADTIEEAAIAADINIDNNDNKTNHHHHRNNDYDDEDGEAWVKPTDVNPKFPFGHTRRAPYFWFNRCCFVFSFVLFWYFAIQIYKQYFEQMRHPPTSRNYVSGTDQEFPGMAFCLHQTSKTEQPPLEPLWASLDHGGPDQLNILESFQAVDCATSTSGRPLNATDQNKCWYLKDGFAAFNTSAVYENESCAHVNDLSVAFYFNISEYSPFPLLVGLDGYLFPQAKAQVVVDRICEAMNNPYTRQCSNCMTHPESEHELDKQGCRKTLHIDQFYATNRLVNLITLQRRESQTSPKCSVMDKVHWDPQTVVSNRNVNYQIPKNPRNITTLSNEQELESTIMMSFRFRDGDIDTTNFNFQSFGTMFGALGGWWGFLSDGYGYISVLFMVEELINYFRATRFR